MSPYGHVGLLGEGGSGRVYLAKNRAGRQVALKVFHPEVAADQSLAEQITADARAIAELDHPNVAKVLDAGTLADGSLFVAVEYIEGRDLGDLLADEQALDYERVVEIGVQTCRGLAAAHQRGLLHLDLKPNNIRLATNSDGDHVKLLDFGLGAASATAGPPATGRVMGTPEYWSPEQASAQPVDARSDLYSLGVILYEALTGTPPFSSHSYSDLVAQHLYAIPNRLMPPAPRRPIPGRIQDAVLECLSKDPLERPPTADALAAALTRRESKPLPVAAIKVATKRVPTGKVVPPQGPVWRRWLALSLAAGATFGLGVLAAVAFSSVPFGESASATSELSPLPEASAAAAPVALEVLINSEPQGAFLFQAGGSVLLGRTPTRLQLDRDGEPLELLVRLPDGQRVPLRVRPDGPAELTIRAPSNNEQQIRD